MEQNATERTTTTRFGGKSVCRWTGTGSACGNVCDFESHVHFIVMKCTFK